MITYADYSLTENINNYIQLLNNYPIIYYILGIVIVLSLMIMMTLKNKRSFFFTLSSVVVVIIFTFYYRGLDMFNQITSIFNSHFYQNIFFYYWNVIIGLLLIHITIHEPRRDNIFRFIMMIFYCLTLTQVMATFYITSVVDNNLILVVGNTAPLVTIGNLILFVMYIYLIVLKIMAWWDKKTIIIL